MEELDFVILGIVDVDRELQGHQHGSIRSSAPCQPACLLLLMPNLVKVIGWACLCASPLYERHYRWAHFWHVRRGIANSIIDGARAHNCLCLTLKFDTNLAISLTHSLTLTFFLLLPEYKDIPIRWNSWLGSRCIKILSGPLLVLPPAPYPLSKLTFKLKDGALLSPLSLPSLVLWVH